MKKEIKWSIAAVLLLCMGVVVYFLFLRPAPVSHTTFFLAEGLASQTECHIMDSGKEGPTIFLLAGTHGNEPAGFKGAEQLLERLEPKTGIGWRGYESFLSWRRGWKSHSDLVCTDYGADPKISASLRG